MIDVHKAFVSALVHQSPGLMTVYKQTLEHWSPEEPPVTTLFAALGDGIAADYPTNEREVNRRIFVRIEAAMNSDDYRLVTAVATGLIESMANRMIKQKQIIEKLKNELGVRSQKHVEAWIGDTLASVLNSEQRLNNFYKPNDTHRHVGTTGGTNKS